MSYDNSHTTDRLQQPDLPETASAIAPEAPAPRQDRFANAAWKPDSYYQPINPDPVVRQATSAQFPRDSDFEPVTPPDRQPPPGPSPAAFPRDADFKPIPPPVDPGPAYTTTAIDSPNSLQDPAGERVQPRPGTPEATAIRVDAGNDNEAGEVLPTDRANRHPAAEIEADPPERRTEPVVADTVVAAAPDVSAREDTRFANSAWKPDSYYPPVNPDPGVQQRSPAPFPRDSDYSPIPPDQANPTRDDSPVPPPRPDAVPVPVAADSGPTAPPQAVPGREQGDNVPTSPADLLDGSVPSPSVGRGNEPETAASELDPADSDEAPSGAQPDETAETPNAPDQQTTDRSGSPEDTTTPVQLPEVPRYAAEDLAPTGRFDPSNPDRELLRGPDGKNHFPGDRIGTFRDSLGDLHDRNGYTSDDNRADDLRLMEKGPSETLTPDLETREGAAFDSAASEYRSIAATRDTLWKSGIAPITDRLTAAGLPPVDKASFGGASFPAYEAAAAEHLTRADRLALRSGAETWRQLHKDQVASGERLGLRAGDYIAAQKFPTAMTVTGGTDAPGTSGNFDRTLFQQDPPKFVVFEEKGASSRLETRWVPNPSDPSGPEIKSQQCSPEYVRGIAPIDNKMGTRLGRDQDLAAQMQQTVTGANGGNVECWVIRGLPTGKITVTQAIMNPLRLLREGIRLSGYRERDTT